MSEAELRVLLVQMLREQVQDRPVEDLVEAILETLECNGWGIVDT